MGRRSRHLERSKDRFRDRLTLLPARVRLVVSGATLLGLDPALSARYATYHELADVLRAFAASPRSTAELFARIVYNVIVGNTDDHARNHAAFWDGRALHLSPAFDICPQLRTGNETRQAMEIGRDGLCDANLAGCVAHAADFGVGKPSASSSTRSTPSVTSGTMPASVPA